MYRFLYSRRWLAALAVVIVFVAVCAELGLWQVRRLDQRKKLNAVVSAHMHLPVVPVGDALRGSDARGAIYRRVTAKGTYDVSQEVLLTGRAFNNRPGSDVLTPLVTSDGRALIVNRGFVPLGIDKPASPQTTPPAGEVTVTGILLPSETRGVLGQKEPLSGHLSTIVRIDVDRIGKQLPYPPFQAYLLLSSQQPSQSGALPQLESYIPDLTNGPHLSYAIQWFFFALIAIAAYLVIARRTAHGKQREDVPLDRRRVE
jgi:cytochrome oxidase assembly protein ShyY1